jgi:arginase
MADLTIANVHLDLGAGRRGVDMGPSAIHLAGLKAGVEHLGHRIAETFQIIVPSQEMADHGDPSARFLTEITAACAQLADRVEDALERGRLPVVLGGDHSVAIGSISGAARYWRKRGKKLGVLWVDAHTDMNTPDTSPSGNVHGMPLAVLIGHGPPELVALAGSEPALDPASVAIMGVRDVDSLEREIVKKTGVRCYTMSELDERGTAACIREAIERVQTDTVGTYLSFDLDGVDPQHAPGVGTAIPGGLDLREAHLICEKVAATRHLVGIDMVELNPVLDTENKTGKLSVWLIQSALGKTIL